MLLAQLRGLVGLLFLGAFFGVLEAAELQLATLVGGQLNMEGRQAAELAPEGNLDIEPEGDGATQVHAHHPQPVRGGNQGRCLALNVRWDLQSFGALHFAGAEALLNDHSTQALQVGAVQEEIRVKESFCEESVHQGPGIAAAIQLGVELLDFSPALQAAHKDRALLLAAIGKGQAPAIQGLLEEELLQGPLVLEVFLCLALLHLEEGGLGDIQVTPLHQFRHLAVEESEQQGADMRTIHVSVRHEDDLVVAQVFDLELILADARTQGLDEHP